MTKATSQPADPRRLPAPTRSGRNDLRRVDAVADPVLRRCQSALEDMYGERLERVVLFGSRARGDARPDFDYDLAVFLTDLSDRWAELDRLADLAQAFLIDSNAFFDAKPYASTAWNKRTPLMREIHLDGIDL